ncbi:hypothetical protein GF339_04740 [candidate division KSB3 bacterium]|uniref:Carbohydrate kinase PfkB domain-containing protein n=1 Tax=candidate division KSB3 bacterium TaxID=2044937 RepID=A0A9D5JTD5_9BACT|nr:hypothetical protein [candidate division KSB3 bacterium]MBD3323867.1 hypothetical protein [candidate division KSB3 bacterium]
MVDIVCLGELLIDFVSQESGVSLIEAPSFQKAAGGAPANVAVGLARLGHQVGFVGKVGQESFGEFLVGVLRDNKVDVSGISFDDYARTMLAFVSLTEEGERDFMFYRHPSADMRLIPEEIPEDLISQAAIFHYGSISLISEPCRSATFHALEIAKQHNLLISYDPNLRLGLWESVEQARKEMLDGMRYATIVKINEEELEFLTGTQDFEEGGKQILDHGPSLLILTLGKQGCYFYSPSAQGSVPGYSIRAVDTTGAGDGFVAGLLSGFLKDLTPHDTFTVPERDALEECCRFANAVGALTSLKRGAIPSLPTPEEVEEFINKA